jgi:hypothetical protein
MAVGNSEVYAYKQIATSTQIKTGDGQLAAIFVSAASATPTITVYDNTAASGTEIISVFTPVASTLYTFPVGFGTGLYVALGGTVSCTVLYL